MVLAFIKKSPIILKPGRNILPFSFILSPIMIRTNLYVLKQSNFWNHKAFWIDCKLYYFYGSVVKVFSKLEDQQKIHCKKNAYVLTKLKANENYCYKKYIINKWFMGQPT